jgi:hypothetical protein
VPRVEGFQRLAISLDFLEVGRANGAIGDFEFVVLSSAVVLGG